MSVKFDVILQRLRESDDQGGGGGGGSGGSGYTPIFVSADRALANGDWAICTADCTLTLPEVEEGAAVKISTAEGVDGVSVVPATGETVDGDAEGLELNIANSSAELVGTASGWVIASVGGIVNALTPDLSNISSAGKGVISDTALELDWAAAFAPEAANVTYEAERAGILFAKGTATNASATLGVWVYAASNQSGGVYSTSVYVPDGKAAYLSIPVPRGTYFYVQAGNVTINAMSFIPFKNSIANS